MEHKSPENQSVAKIPAIFAPSGIVPRLRSSAARNARAGPLILPRGVVSTVRNRITPPRVIARECEDTRAATMEASSPVNACERRRASSWLATGARICFRRDGTRERERDPAAMLIAATGRVPSFRPVRFSPTLRLSALQSRPTNRIT